MLPEQANARTPQTAQNRALQQILGNRQRFLNFVRSRIHDPSEAEEILQSAALKMISRASTLRDPQRAEAWVYRLLRNEIADYFRQLAVSSRRTAELPSEVPAAELPEYGGAKICSCAKQELQSLHSNYFDALHAIEMDGETIAAYAARKGTSVNSATVRLHRARKALRVRLESRCGACAGAGCFDCTCPSDSHR